MIEKRHILIGAVGLLKGNVREDSKVMTNICDEFEPFFLSDNLLESAPFDTISLIIRYGYRKKDPEIGKINKRYCELEVAVEVPMEKVRKLKYDDLYKYFREVTLDALITVAKKFNLPCSIWLQLQNRGKGVTH
jgi:hypothetical protein